MPLSSLLESATGTCPFCNQKAGILSRSHPPSAAGPSRPAGTRCSGSPGAPLGRTSSTRIPSKSTLAEIARLVIRKRQYSRPGAGRGLEKGSSRNAAADGSITHEEKFRTPEVPGPAGTEPEQRPHPGDGTTEPDIQAEAPVVDPSRRHHC